MRWDETSLPEVYGAARELTPEALATWRTTLPALVPASPTIRNVVDLGCGTGRFSRLLAELYGGAIIAMDPSVRMLAHRVSIDRGSVRFLAGVAEGIPLATQASDLVFLSMVYHHLVSIPQALEEMRRVLRPSGLVIVRNSTREAHEEGYEYLRFFPEAMELERQRMPTRGAVTRAFVDLGFTGARHLVVRQQIAENHSELLRRIRLRGLSSLAAISDAAFYRGLHDLEQYCLAADQTRPSSSQ
jgi:ubiquinone/menaquinone biosynthesis C-methylase UbiE